MKKNVLLVGNDINNITPNNSWKDLLHEIIRFCNAQELVTNIENKPFPLLYEEIFLKSLKIADRKESELKRFIANKVSKVEENEIHRRIREFRVNDIITTNYEFALEGTVPEKNTGIIEERLYSVFRHYRIDSKKYWHIHGDCRSFNSINLGFEHYCGQLQQIRNYIVTGTNYKSKAVSSLPLIKRLQTKGFVGGESWIDLFFTSDIHILGLSLDFVETDLWWLLTYRARQLFYKRRPNINNTIYYFIPKEYKIASKEKIDLLQANGIEVVGDFSGKDKLVYYHQVLDWIEQRK